MVVLSILSRKTLYLLLLYYLKTKRRQQYKKSMRVRKLFRSKSCISFINKLFNLFIKDMQLFDHKYFFKFFRMTPTPTSMNICQVSLHQRLQNLPSNVKQLEQVKINGYFEIFGGTSRIDLAGMFQTSLTFIG